MAPALYEKSCNLKDGLGCNALGTLYQEGKSIDKSEQKAFSYFEKACSLKVSDGCMNLGLMYKNTPGKNNKPDYKSAIKYLEMSCNMNNGLACGYLGLMHEKGEGVERSYRRGKVYYDKSCALKSSFGCDMSQKLDDIEP